MTDAALGKPATAVSPVVFIVAAASAALFAANLYYAQPLLTTIAADIGLSPQFAGAVVSASQFGYGLGLFLLVPLSDMVENRRLVLICSGLTFVGILGVAFTQSAIAFLCSALVVGVFSSGAQVLVPYLSHMIPEDRRGRIIGSVLAGILTAIMFARPFALFVTAAWGWRSVYLISAVVTAALGLALWRTMPPRQPPERNGYWRVIGSMFSIFASEPHVLRRTFYQAVLFSSFTMFWATLPILLAERFGFDHRMIGVFALVAAGGILIAPLAGRLSDRGGVWIGTIIASLCLVGAFACSLLSVHLAIPIGLAAASVVVDGSIQGSQILSRMVVLDVPPGVRGRINALYMTSIFICGAIGSALGVSIYFIGGWSAVAFTGMAGGAVVFLAAVTEGRFRQTR